MAIKGYSAFPKAQALQEPHHQIVQYPGHSSEETCPSAEMQSIYSTSPADWANGSVVFLFLYFWSDHTKLYIYQFVWTCTYPILARKKFLYGLRNWFASIFHMVRICLPGKSAFKHNWFKHFFLWVYSSSLKKLAVDITAIFLFLNS